MPTFDFSIYNIDPWTLFSQTIGDSTTYTGPATADGDVTLTDNGSGIDGQTLEDDSSGETATADIFINGVLATGVDVSSEETWTLLDTVTGQSFEVVTFHVESGPNAGYYSLSEIPLVAGRVYQTQDFDSTPNAGAGDPVFSYADYSFPAPDGVVDGTAGDDVIDGSYLGDPDGDVVDGNDAPGSGSPTSLEFNWDDYSDETDLSGGVSQNTGGIQVDVSYSNPAGGDFSAEHTSTLYTVAGEPFNPNSGAYIFQDGNATDAQVTFDFSANAGSGFEDTVQNVRFRISDVDGLVNGANNFQDILTITAFDVYGNAIPVTITAAGTVTVAGNTATGALSNTSEDQATGSILVQIPGPVAQIVINYDNAGDTQQAVFLTDLHFDTVPIGSNDDVIQAGAGDDIVDGLFGDDQIFGEAGNDTLTGGQGADLLDGGTGDDILNVGSGDTATGGEGDDTFVIDSGLLGGGTITVTGGETGETVGDTLDFAGQLVPGSVVITDNDDANGGLSGSATLIDGTVVNFSEIENIICFAEGTRIDTPDGARPIETLRPGDLVLTADRGPVPLRWHGARSVSAINGHAPVRFDTGAIGNSHPLLVSPQHRILIRDHRAQLHFGEEEVLVAAKALIDGRKVTNAPAETICYHHLLFDWHEIIVAEGAQTESYHPGIYSLDNLEEAAREELFGIFPALRSDPSVYGPLARTAIRSSEAQVLAA